VVLEPQGVQQQPEGRRKPGEEVTEELDWKPAHFILSESMAHWARFSALEKK
jgi:hypothetical protein